MKVRRDLTDRRHGYVRWQQRVESQEDALRRQGPVGAHVGDLADGVGAGVGTTRADGGYLLLQQAAQGARKE